MATGGATKRHLRSEREMDTDEVDMAKMGKSQEMRRNFGLWSLLGLSMPFMATWIVVLFANSTAIENGGPATLIYGFLYAWIGSLATAVSLAEMASMYPTSSGQFHWTSKFSPPRYQALLSWICGYISLLGWIGNVTAAAFVVAVNIQGLLIQVQPSYGFERWHGSLIGIGVCVVAITINIIGTKLLSVIEAILLVLYLASYLAFLVPLVHFSPTASPQAVFQTFAVSSGWDDRGLAFFIGFISSSVAFIGIDGPTHMAEEARNARVTVPKAMVATVFLNGATGWGMAIAFSFCILPNIKQALTSPSGSDWISVFYIAMGKAGAVAFASLLVSIVFLASLGGLATTSRQLWAFARDAGLPYSDFFSLVDQRLKVPLRAIVLCGIIPCLLLLVNIGSTVAFNSVISLSTACLFTSYLIPITLLTIKRLKCDKLPYGPWSIGRFSVPASIFAIIFLVISIFFSFWPPSRPVTPVTMNYSCAVVGGFVVIGLAWYAYFGKKVYNGPNLGSTAVEE